MYVITCTISGLTGSTLKSFHDILVFCKGNFRHNTLLMRKLVLSVFHSKKICLPITALGKNIKFTFTPFFFKKGIPKLFYVPFGAFAIKVRILLRIYGKNKNKMTFVKVHYGKNIFEPISDISDTNKINFKIMVIL